MKTTKYLSKNNNSRSQRLGILALTGLALASACGLFKGGTHPGSNSRPAGLVPTTTSSSAFSDTTNQSQLSGNITYGIDVNQFDSDIGPQKVPQVLQMIRQAGARAVRIGASWATTEPSPGVFNWTGVDKLLSTANTDGLVVLYELGNEPAWDALGGNVNAPPSDCASPSASCSSVITYVSNLIAHARNEGLNYLIVRNEPQNFNKNWVGGTAAAYAHFQQVVYQTAHQASPTIKVLNGGTEAVSASLAKLRNQIQPQTAYMKQVQGFASELYSNPIWCDSLDVLDVHVGDHGPVYSPQIVDASEAALQACNGGKHVPVWVTEVGYPSLASLQASHVYQVELGGNYQGGEAGQARYLTDTFNALAKDPNVIGINWTFMIDPNLNDTVPAGATYNQTFSAGMGAGLAYASYKEKAAYQAFQLASRGGS